VPDDVRAELAWLIAGNPGTANGRAASAVEYRDV